jgi:hypothetical protein
MLTIFVVAILISIVGVLLYALTLEVINKDKRDNFFIFILSLLKFGKE